MKKLLLFIPALTVGSLHADIAPTSYTGTNVFPVHNTEVRMARADVRIVWGIPSTLQADFILTNDTSAEITLETGFPVGAMRYTVDGNVNDGQDDTQAKPQMVKAESEVISILVNGLETPAFFRIPHLGVKEVRKHSTSWYFATLTLKPGENIVEVRTQLQPSGVSAFSYQRRLSYCISTGGRWKGPIEREMVEIVFPGIQLTDIVIQTQPTTAQISGETIRWTFSNIEPKGDEYDIELTFLLPKVAAKLASLRSAYEQNPDDAATALRYATHLFHLSRFKGNSGFPPERFTNAQYHRLRNGIDDEQDRRSFDHFYRKTADGYRSKTTAWTGERREIIRILADSGYSSDDPATDRVAEAKSIVEKSLARHPKNADGWAVYLAHFWKFSFAARGHWFGPTVYSKPLRRAIESAFQHCPGDPRIQAWYEAMLNNAEAPTVPPPDRSRTAMVSEVFQNEFNQ